MKVGCPLRAGTVEVAREYGLPIVVPSEGAAELKCCTQKLVQVRRGDHVKHQQDLYWGAAAWVTSWARRTYVEGVFGNLKNPSTENIQRGFLRMVGMPMVTLSLTAAAVSYNIREYNNWLDRTAQTSDHPLAQETQWVHGHTMLTAVQAAELDRRWEPAIAA